MKSDWWRTLVPYVPFALIVVTIIAVFYPVLNNQLLDFWDDQWVVMNHYTESGITLHNIWSIFSEYYHGQYAPFNELLYLILYSAFGYDPFFFHMASLMLHIVNACLVYMVMKKLLTMSGRVDVDKIPLIALLTALFFAVHPLTVESVAWMSASKVLVYAMFYLLASYAFLHYLEKQKIRFYIFTVLLFLFSFLGKEQAVVFPMWMLLIFWLLNYKLTDRKVWLIVLPFFVLSFVLGVVTILSQHANGAGFLTGGEGYPLWQRIIYASYSFLEYLFKILAPFKLSYLYPFPSAVGDPLPEWLIFYPALILIMVVSLWHILKKWPVAFGLLLFTIHIAVALHIIPLSRFTVVADRHVYLAIIGIGFIASYYITILYHWLRRKELKIAVIAIFFCYLIYLGTYALQRTYIWYSTDTLKKELRELLKQRNDYHEYKKLMSP